MVIIFNYFINFDEAKVGEGNCPGIELGQENHLLLKNYKVMGTSISNTSAS